MSDRANIKQIITYIEQNCPTTITPKQTDNLLKMRRKRKYTIDEYRELFRIAIDNFIYPECPYCKKSITTQEDLTIDHIIPRSLGGKDNIENLQPMHKKCNSDKGCKMPEQTTCPDVPVKKHRKPKKETKHKERDIVKSRTPEELYQKCKKIDQARVAKCHTTVRGYSK